MRKAPLIALIVVSFLSFMAGMFLQRFLYDDACLDMGGGINPDGARLCVIEVPAGS